MWQGEAWAGGLPQGYDGDASAGWWMSMCLGIEERVLLPKSRRCRCTLNASSASRLWQGEGRPARASSCGGSRRSRSLACDDATCAREVREVLVVSPR